MGLVERVEVEDDRRKRMVCLTPAGIEAWNDLHARSNTSARNEGRVGRRNCLLHRDAVPHCAGLARHRTGLRVE